MVDVSSAQERVRRYWDGKPADSEYSDKDRLSLEYFREIERRRYALQPHVPRLLSGFDWAGKRVLEIGTGVGTDARFLIGRGALYTGINIDQSSTDATARALSLFGLPGVVQRGDATALEFRDESFDAVYAFGVLHHIPEAARAVSEIRRVLNPGGNLLAMVYNRTSINYAVEIMFLRKLGVRALAVPGALALLGALGLPRDKLERHVELWRGQGRMSDEEWLSRNTDGPDNPYSRVYDAAEAAALFSAFEIRSNQPYFFDHRHWGPLGRALPRGARAALGRRWGWHRVVHAVKR